MKTLSIVVPCYNSAEYMRRCLDSVIVESSAVEVIVVNDGSTDATGEIAEEYAARFPHHVIAIHTANGGHGSAVNAGIDRATGRYVRVVDSDDWVDATALEQLIGTIAAIVDDGKSPDVVVSNFTYEKADKRLRRVVRYRNALPRGKVFGWDEFGQFRTSQYLLMHALTYRRQLLKDIEFRLPAHTFYVDNLYASVPLQSVRTLFYLDVDLYRYFIGRPDQSVNEAVMLHRLDQQVRVTNLMRAALPQAGEVHPAQYRYLLHYFGIVSAVTSLMLIRSGSRENISRKAGLWSSMREEDPRVHRRVRRSALGHLVNLPGRTGRRTTVLAYQVARWVVGFN